MEKFELAISRLVAALPSAITRPLAGRPVEIDGQRLHPEIAVMLRAERMLGLEKPPPSVEAERAQNRRAARLARGRTITVAAVEEVEVPGAAGDLPARLYVPPDPPPAGPLLVYFHGGGYVIGDLDTHDQVCRFLCARLPSRVLSVAYRLAPEHPFPAALDDARAAFAHVAGVPTELGADPGRVAIGGDSAGGALAAAVSIAARDEDEPQPSFQLLIYPWCDHSRARRSHGLFGEGFFLTREKLERWSAAYLDDADAADPRASPLLTEDLSGLPPSRLLVAGFDPLRDECLEFAARLREAGNDVRLTVVSDLVHGFVNTAGFSHRCADALAEFVDEAAAGLPTPATGQ